MNDLQQLYITGRTAADIASSIEAGVREGRLEPGGRLPTVRSLAAALGVSPTTVAAVYRELRRRGLVAAAGRLGTTIRFRPPVSGRGKPTFPAGVRDLASGNPDPALLPDLAAALARLDPRHVLYGESSWDPELLELARRRLDADAIPSEHVTLVGGALDGVE